LVKGELPDTPPLKVAESEADEEEGEEKGGGAVGTDVPKTPTVEDPGGGVNAEMRRLLRAPRYFDEDFEQAAVRCLMCRIATYSSVVPPSLQSRY
jgi:hypothetical protein